VRETEIAIELRIGNRSFRRANNKAAARQFLPAFQTLKKHEHSFAPKSPRYGSRKLEKIQEKFARDGALEQMFVASHKRFVAVAHSILRNREDAEDAVQEAFFSAHRHWRSFEGRSALSTWLTRIVLNAALMIRRKRKSSTIHPLPEKNSSREVNWTENIAASEPNPEIVHADRESLQLIDGIVGKMKPVLRQAFIMTYFDELSGAEASTMLGISAGTFKSRLFRAKRRVIAETGRALLTPTHKKNLHLNS
jgi:RNA polymerase sigma factor (sigma-70 family)